MRSILILFALIALIGCQSKEESISKPESTPEKPTAQAEEKQDTATEPAETPTPPTPPISEDFESAPILSLFPRVVDFQPEPDDHERLPYWRSFIGHVSKSSGVRITSKEPPNRALKIKAIDSIDSVAFFAPLAVEPNSSYEVSFRFKGDIPEGGRAGIAALEFNEFLWIGEQFTESQAKQYQVGVIKGIDIESTEDWIEQSHVITVGAKTEMIHLIFYRDGEDGKKSVFFDDILIKPTSNQ